MADRIVLFLQGVVQVYFRMGLRLRVRGVENIPATGPVILAANHVSGYDPFIAGSLVPRLCHYLAKKELFENVFLGSLLRFLRAIPVDRHGQTLSAIREISRVLEKKGMVLLFPEGTRSKDGQVRKPKGGIGMLAVTTHAVIVPAYIGGMYKAKPSIFKRPEVSVAFGKPINPGKIASDHLSRKEKYNAISNEVYTQLLALSKQEKYRCSAPVKNTRQGGNFKCLNH
jgi:1-acyl-sn-glycerol-3-phosphate acyltransferase